MLATRDEVKKYWDKFYATKLLGIEDIPSQFAAFVLSEFSGVKTIIDIGCGNGRDSFFFSRHVCNVFGIDASQSAIDYCNKKKRYFGFNKPVFCCLDLSKLDSCIDFLDSIQDELQDSVLYARFVLHAIDEGVEKNFLKLASFVSKKGGVIAVEFRTHRDEQQQKETSAHYRRYINPLDFIDRARAAGLNISYYTEGFGLAKYKSDDAHVARCIFQSNRLSVI